MSTEYLKSANFTPSTQSVSLAIGDDPVYIDTILYGDTVSCSCGNGDCFTKCSGSDKSGISIIFTDLLGTVY